MTKKDDIRFYIAEQVELSDCPLETIEEIEDSLKQLKKLYTWKEEDLKGIEYGSKKQ